MTNAAAFSATYSDFKIVRGRKCAQIVLEVPLENADAALAALGGVPRPDAEIWVGVARIDPKAVSKPAQSDIATPKERRRFDTLPLPQQVAMTCQEGAFQRFVEENHNFAAGKPIERFIREFCQVGTRAEILPGTLAEALWHKLNDEYQAWMRVG